MHDFKQVNHVQIQQLLQWFYHIWLFQTPKSVWSNVHLFKPKNKMKRTIPDKYTIKLTIPDHVKSRRSYIYSSPTQFTINRLLDIFSFCIVFNFCWFTSVSCNPKATTLSSLSLFCVFSSAYPSIKSWWSILSTIYLSCF